VAELQHGVLLGFGQQSLLIEGCRTGRDANGLGGLGEETEMVEADPAWGLSWGDSSSSYTAAKPAASRANTNSMRLRSA